MVTVSSEFHQAIRDDELQMPLFIFDNTVMSSQDIEISSGGIRFSESVMKEEDFEPGACVASTLSVDVLNETGAWTNFEFGEFKALLGVRTVSEVSHAYISECHISTGSHSIDGWLTAPYLRLDGAEVSGVSEPVMALVLWQDKLLAFTDSGYEAYTWDGSTLTKATLTFYDQPILENSVRWMDLRYGIVYGVNIGIGTSPSGTQDVLIFHDQVVDGYEMCPLGIFNADKPMYSSKKTVTMDAYDRMNYLDEDYTSLTYPITLDTLCSTICQRHGIPYDGSSGTFPNLQLTLSSEPEDFTSATDREVLQWICQIVGCFAKMTREGHLILKWFGTASIQLDGHDYSDCDIGYYNAASVNKVVIRKAGEDDVTSGTGSNAIYIQNNPIANALLWPDTDE